MFAPEKERRGNKSTSCAEGKRNKMQFWRIDSPDYESDYDYSFVNGSLEHPYGFPGIKCDECGQTWGGSRILSIECPSEFRNHKNIKDAWPIPFDSFLKLREKVKSTIGKDIEFEPGERLQPSYLDVPSKPCSDFLWSSIESVVVSERIKSLLENIANGDVDFVKVIKRKIGKQSPKLPAPIASTGDPADIIDEIELLKNVEEVPDYYEMVIKNESKMPIFTKINSSCNKCKRVDIDDDSRLFQMVDEIWNGHSIFYLATTLYIIVTDNIKNKLEELSPTNIQFKNITRKE
jgi:hypothetical protein